jgi:hypothetical protein
LVKALVFPFGDNVSRLDFWVPWAYDEVAPRANPNGSSALILSMGGDERELLQESDGDVYRAAWQHQLRPHEQQRSQRDFRQPFWASLMR